MEQYNPTTEILNYIPGPSFTVVDGRITRVSEAARKFFLEPGMEIHPMLVTGQEEYGALTDGCLYLTMKIAEIPCNAAVSRMEGFDLFTLEQEADQSELQAIALASQELRTPLSSIMTVADQLFPAANGVDSPENAQIARINRALFQMLRIVSNMSDAYRYSQQTEPRLTLVDMRSLMEDIFSKAAPLMESTGITLHFTNLSRSTFCLAEPEKLERAVNNILSNAVKFSGKSGRIDAKIDLKGTMFHLTVQDYGSGVPDELRGHIHSRFLRQPGLEDNRFGIGLGMVLIRSAAEAHGGTVLFEQPEEGGTRITMTIAYRQSTDSALHASMLHVDYAGERDHALIELSDVLPIDYYQSGNIN